MITSNVYQRVFHIRNRLNSGTCFTIEIDNKQYLVTAKHVIEGLSISDRIQIFHQNQWKYIDIVVVGSCDDPIDVSVLRPSIQLSPTLPLEASMEGIVFGQDIYFLGFPYSISSDVGDLNRNFPLPLVKKGILSALCPNQAGVDVLYLDGHSNPGFSGGPVVFCDPFRPASPVNPFKVAGVISGNRAVEEPIYDGSRVTHLTYRYNTGIIVAHKIQHALDLIQMNPIGLEVASGSTD